ncbi:hypothetical protein LJC22_02165 [Desulfosarcina sp. OttesenSCG-928-G10]|nr:hypothetical protein [Desulfosarcina sp. OttesenSCG-928-G10]MDL2321062.1 hypothetical protein [Desulfosarcina sp. OttesenSCG-928-B08]
MPNNANPFYTLTMARVYANQGQLDAALRIYRYLAAKTPDREDIRSEMAALEARMPKIPDNWARVADAVESWVRLVMYQDTLRRFQSFLDPQDPAPCSGALSETAPLSLPKPENRTVTQTSGVLPDILVDLIPEHALSAPFRTENGMPAAFMPTAMKDSG